MRDGVFCFEWGGIEYCGATLEMLVNSMKNADNNAFSTICERPPLRQVKSKYPYQKTDPIYEETEFL